MVQSLGASQDDGIFGGGLHIVANVGRLLHPLGTRSPRRRDTFREACASDDLRRALDVCVGDWVALFPRSHKDDEEPLLVRLVEAGEGAEVCPLSSQPPSSGSCGGKLPSIYLPANLLEFLKATPGRSTLTVAKRAPASFAPPLASRLVLSRVRVPDMRGQCRRALKSFFSVPRALREGELLCVPVGGLPSELLELEAAGLDDGGRGPSAHDFDDDDLEPATPATASAASGAAVGALVLEGVVPRPCAENFFDPVGGFAFHGLLMFRVESVALGRKAPDAVERRPRRCCCTVDRSSTEVLVEGHCQARGIPYMASHLFCQPPASLPTPLQDPFMRILSTLATAVRAWAQDRRPGVPPHSVLVTGPRGCGKRLLWGAVCDRLGLHLLEVNCFQLVSQSPNAVEDTIEELLIGAAAGSPAVIVLRRLQALAAGGATTSPAALLLLQRRLEAALSGALRRLHATAAAGAGGAAGDGGDIPLVVLAGTCEDVEAVGGPLRKIFQVEIELARPDQAARREVAARVLGAMARRQQPRQGRPTPSGGGGGEGGALAESIAKLTAGLSYTDLRSVCSELAMHGPVDLASEEEPKPEQVECLEKAVKRLQGGSKVAVALAGKVQWADVGGLEGAKEEIMNCITLPLSQGQMFSGQKVRSGVLLFGPPGTGKTLLAKAVATECKVHFLSIKGPEMLSMYIGESERNIRDLFQKARELAPCVLFFDELDALAPARGRGSDSGGVMDRVVSQLITELDTMPATVFLVGATNRPDLLDRSLLRPGRLDRMVYLGIASEKLPMLKAITRKFHLEDEMPDGSSGAVDSDMLETVSRACPPNLTGADVSVLCADAYGQAQKEHLDSLHKVAEQVQVSIQTLLLFLETLEHEVKIEEGTSSASVSSSGAAFQLLFPTPSTAQASTAPQLPSSGLMLLRGAPPLAGVLVVAHRPEGGAAADAGAGAGAAAAGSMAAALFGPEGRAATEGAEDAWRAFAGGSTAGLVASAPLGLRPLSALQVKVGSRHFRVALERLQPSVSVQDLARYEQLAQEYSNTKR